MSLQIVGRRQKKLASMGPLIEIGAGKGQWQRAIEDRGGDVLAFDDGSTPSPPVHQELQSQFLGQVQLLSVWKRK